MDKNSEKPAQQLVLTPEQLQQLLQAVQANSMELVKSYIEEARKPTPQQEKAAQKAREHWELLTKQMKEKKAYDQSACTHIHVRENKSHVWRGQICYPQGAMVLICSRCRKEWRNYEKGRLLSPEERKDFTYWYNYPSLSIVE